MQNKVQSPSSSINPYKANELKNTQSQKSSLQTKAYEANQNLDFSAPIGLIAQIEHFARKHPACNFAHFTANPAPVSMIASSLCFLL